MTDMPERGPAHGAQAAHRGGWLTRAWMNPRLHAAVARMPGLGRIARSEGAAMFGLVGGFVNSQILLALVELGILEALVQGPQAAAALARPAGLAEDRMAILLQGGAALRLLRRRRDGRFALTRRGAVLLGVPGLVGMIRHHAVFYRDLADPVALLRGGTETGLARFWPYVFGAEGASDTQVTADYSALMSDTQGLVAEDTLRCADLSGVRRLLDVGGGTGAFLAAAGARYPSLELALFDLPAVVGPARARFAAAGMAGRVTILPGSFRDDPIPAGADAISLVRVLYDHTDETVAALLAAVFAALPRGGRLIISEPMSGGDRPDAITDTYFAFYTLAMGTGRTRSGARLAELVTAAGFDAVTIRPGPRPYITGLVLAHR
ncbi:MAG: SAM-dependent methyltransferase [Rhodobacter sp.]|nr:SAM-dependent methyltransferase [Rhodobacter sp.]MCA3514608.1 SAM-dependent methyltransferase [Rhodobacter sp.]MCA3521587.1 SAM-dependent methyltransferase [Rhodobacter sp.]MCA3523250.1 SAM-dependent methyltransferase [Rhodobacter sp.]MCA3525780.1 SAM-dependent methyltransferase [Rhodobacter sp.]